MLRATAAHSVFDLVKLTQKGEARLKKVHRETKFLASRRTSVPLNVLIKFVWAVWKGAKQNEYGHWLWEREMQSWLVRKQLFGKNDHTRVRWLVAGFPAIYFKPFTTLRYIQGNLLLRATPFTALSNSINLLAFWDKILKIKNHQFTNYTELIEKSDITTGPSTINQMCIVNGWMCPLAPLRKERYWSHRLQILDFLDQDSKPSQLIPLCDSQEQLPKNGLKQSEQ